MSSSSPSPSQLAVVTVAAAASVVLLVSLTRRRWKASGGAAEAPSPRVVILFSGKRKSGKDYLCERLEAFLNSSSSDSTNTRVTIGRLSGPLKKAYADEHGLDYQELLSDGPYKEKYRKDMIAWGVARREADPGYFPRLVLAQLPRPVPPVLIISDARRRTDFAFFRDDPRWTCLSVRVEASQDTRAGRGWKFTPGVDDVDSECGLDGRSDWSMVIHNDRGDGAEHVERIAEAARQKLV